MRMPIQAYALEFGSYNYDGRHFKSSVIIITKNDMFWFDRRLYVKESKH